MFFTVNFRVLSSISLFFILMLTLHNDVSDDTIYIITESVDQ